MRLTEEVLGAQGEPLRYRIDQLARKHKVEPK